MWRHFWRAPTRERLRGFAPPRPLLALLVIVAIVGAAWVVLVPSWDSPDEAAHYGYSESLATSFRLPGDANRSPASTDENEAEFLSGGGDAAEYLESAPLTRDRAAYDAYLRADRAGDWSRTDGGGPTSADQNPPLYYLYADLGYLLDVSGSGVGRLTTMRLLGIPLLLLSTAGAWLLIGETLDHRRRRAQLGGAAVVGLLPMMTFISTSVSTDGLLIATWTWTLWLGARVINRGARTADVAAMFAVAAAAILTKATAYALLPGVALALVIGARRRTGEQPRPSLLRRLPLAAVLLVPVLAWIAVSQALHRPAVNQVQGPTTAAFSVPYFLVYLWEYYLPRLPFMRQVTIDAGPKPFYTFWLAEGTGRFGWLNVPLSGWIYSAATTVWACVSLATLGLLTRLRGTRRLGLLAFFAVELGGLLLLLHLTEFQVFLGTGAPFLQGRYLLPAVGLFGLAVARVIHAVPDRARASAAALVMVGLFVLQVLSLVTVLEAYYL